MLCQNTLSDAHQLFSLWQDLVRFCDCKCECLRASGLIQMISVVRQHMPAADTWGWTGPLQWTVTTKHQVIKHVLLPLSDVNRLLLCYPQIKLFNYMLCLLHPAWACFKNIIHPFSAAYPKPGHGGSRWRKVTQTSFSTATHIFQLNLSPKWRQNQKKYVISTFRNRLYSRERQRSWNRFNSICLHLIQGGGQ